MALAFSVPRAEDKQYSLPEVKLALYRALERGEAENDPMVNVKLFRESIGKPDSYKKRAEIQRATDNGILAWNMLRYRVDIKVGETVQKLMDIPTDEWVMKEEVLRRYLDANMEAKELFHKATGESGAWSSGKLTKEMVDAMSDFYEIKLASTNVNTILFIFLFKFSSVVKQGYFYVYAKPLLLCEANQVSLLT